MTIIKIGPHVITLFDSIMAIPPYRESMMNYYLLADSGIGHTWESIDSHLGSIQMAAMTGDKVNVVGHIENLKINIMTMVAKYNHKQMAWLCLIDEIDGEKLTDISESKLIELSDKFGKYGSDETSNWEVVLDSIIKKFPESWLQTFHNGVEAASMTY